MRLCTFDLDTDLIVEQDGYSLVGSCNGCGNCCNNFYGPGQPCEHVAEEISDGSQLYRCLIYHTRPKGCVIYPTREDVLHEGCAFSWEPVE